MQIISIEHTAVVINGHTVQGWAAQADALMMPDIELAVVERGADGGMIASRTGVKGGPVRLKLLANSPSTAFFMSQAQIIAGGGVVVFEGSIANAEVGYSHRLERGVMTTYPAGQTLGNAVAPPREFVIDFERIIVNYDGATMNPIPALA